MSDGGSIAGVVIGILLGAFLIYSIYNSIYIVPEKREIVIERLGKFKEVLTPGIHCTIPWIDRPKRYTFRYYITDASNVPQLVHKKNQIQINLQREVIDFPKQVVITRDNARISLDAVLQFKVTNAKLMIYSTQNLPEMLSKILQAQLRNVAGSLDVDQVIEDTAGLDRVAGEMDTITSPWGVRVEMVKIQKVDAGDLGDVLAQKKRADLKNREVIIKAKENKQTMVIKQEGERDRLIREAEGEMAQTLSRARGEAQAILNKARAEARSIAEIARAIAKHGENPAKYLLALKYIEALREVMKQPETTLELAPHNSPMQTLSAIRSTMFRTA